MSATSHPALEPARPLATLVPKTNALLALSLGALALLGLGSALRWPMVHDVSIMNYIGWRIAQGDAPYAALFDMNLPATYAFHTLLAYVPGSWDARTAAAHVGLVSACAALCWLWTARVSGRPLAGVLAAALCALLCLMLGPHHALQRDLLLALPALGALMLACASPAPSLRRLCAVGALFGVASAVKPHVLLWLGAYVLAVLLHDGARRALLARLPSASLALAGGFALGWAPLLLWLAWTGGLTELAQTVVPVNAAYARISHSIITDDPDGTLRSFVVPELLSFDAARVLRCVALGIAAYEILFERRCLQRLTIAVATVAGVAMYLIQLKGWPYHLYPSLILLGVPIALLVFERASLERSRVVLHAVVSLAVLVVGLRGVQAAVHGGGPDRKAERSGRVVATLGPHVRDGASVQIFDTAEGGADVLLRLGLPLPTSMLYDFPLFLDHASAALDTEPVRRLRARFLGELHAARPDYLLVFARGWPRGGPERLGWIPELDAWVRAEYCSVASEDDYAILARRARGECQGWAVRARAEH